MKYRKTKIKKKKTSKLKYLHTFLVSYCGVVTNWMGVSAQGCSPAVSNAGADMKKGDLVRNNPISIGMAMSMGLSKMLLRGWYFTDGSISKEKKGSRISW